MLIASSSTIVGAMKSQAIERSESPLARRVTQSGDAEATRSASEGTGVISVMAAMITARCYEGLPNWPPLPSRCPSPGLSPSRFAEGDSGTGERIRGRQGGRLVQLAVVFEDLLPVLDEGIERLLRRALVGDDVVMDALLLGQQELGVGRFGPEVDDLAHRRQEVGGKRCGL